MKAYWIDYLSKYPSPHRQLESYLVLTGWQTFRTLTDATSYSSEDGQKRELIPTNPDYGDYHQGLLYVIEELSSYYKKDLDELFLDIYERAETFRFRFQSNLNAKHNLSLLELTQFTASIKDTLVRTSREIDTVSKNKRKRMESLLDVCQVGQTQPGSYLIKLFIPNVEIDTSKLNAEEKRKVDTYKNRYQRYISSEIYQNYIQLNAFSTSPQNTEEIDNFLTHNFSIGKSVSAAIESNNEFLEVSPKWSGWIEEPKEFPDIVRFEAQQFEWLPARLEVVHKKIQSDTTTVIGHVLLTSRNIDKKGKTSEPSIRIKYKTPEGEMRMARLEVTPEQYSQALVAAKPDSHLVVGLRAKVIRRPRVDLILNEDIESFELHEFNSSDL